MKISFINSVVLLGAVLATTVIGGVAVEILDAYKRGKNGR